MDTHNKDAHIQQAQVSRKEFLKRSTSGLIGIGIAGLASEKSIDISYGSEKAQYRMLGRTGLKVTAVGLGSVRTSGPNVMKKALDMGVTLIDTAYDTNLDMISKVIKGRRHQFIIINKFPRTLKDDRAAIEKSIDESLKRLRTDYIDLMLYHGVDPHELNAPDVFEALDKAKQSGKIRFTGFSCHFQADTLRAAMRLKYYNVAMFPFNHACHFTHMVSGRYHEWDLEELEKEMEKATSMGMGLIAMKTCSGGPRRVEGQTEATYGEALRWILKNKNISSVLPALGNFRELEEDIQVMWS